MPAPTLVLLATLFAAAAHCAAQETADLEAEAKQAEEEDAQERQVAETLGAEYAGTLTLFGVEQRAEYNSGVVGVFARGKLFHLVKLKVPKIEDDLKPYDKKKCTLFGRIRNQGKYIIVERVVLPGAANNFSGRRGGL
jgi:hypothetical protein